MSTIIFFAVAALIFHIIFKMTSKFVGFAARSIAGR